MARRPVVWCLFIIELGHQIDAVQEQLVTHFDRHPDGESADLDRLSPLASWPSSETLRALPNCKARRNYAGASPITRASGRKKWSSPLRGQ